MASILDQGLELLVNLEIFWLEGYLSSFRSLLNEPYVSKTFFFAEPNPILFHDLVGCVSVLIANAINLDITVGGK